MNRLPLSCRVWFLIIVIPFASNAFSQTPASKVGKLETIKREAGSILGTPATDKATIKLTSAVDSNIPSASAASYRATLQNAVIIGNAEIPQGANAVVK